MLVSKNTHHSSFLLVPLLITLTLNFHRTRLLFPFIKSHFYQHSNHLYTPKSYSYSFPLRLIPTLPSYACHIIKDVVVIASLLILTNIPLTSFPAALITLYSLPLTLSHSFLLSITPTYSLLLIFTLNPSHSHFT